MTNFVPISPAQHAGKAWHRPNSYSFASTEAVLPLIGGEFGKVAVAMPIAFVEQGGRYVPVAVMSPVAGSNLFIGPGGQWLGTYVPAALRGYPFCLARVEGTEEATLCIDDDSGLVVDANGTAEAFFDPAGNVAAPTKVLLDFLADVERNRIATDLAVAALTNAGVIQPWSLEVTIEGKATSVTGLHRIDEAALNALDDEAFLKLRKSSALIMAYLQLLSTSQVGVFEQLSRIQQQLAPRKAPMVSLDEFFDAADNETIRFT